MLTVMPISDTVDKARICLECNVSLNNDCEFYGVYENNEIISACRYRKTENQGSILNLITINGGDLNNEFLCLKAVLCNLDLLGIKEIEFLCADEKSIHIAKNLGLINKDGKKFIYSDNLYKEK